MFTSNFGNVKAIEAAGLEPVCISVGKPRWFKGRCIKSLAPTWAMLKMPIDQYDVHYNKILRKLDPAEIAAEIGEKGVILCWEKHGEKCHRRQVAEWLERHLKITVPEFGFAREETPAYESTPLKVKAAKKKADVMWSYVI